MVKLVENKHIKSVSDFCGDGLIGTKIACFLDVYGTDASFFKCWYCEYEGAITSVIAKFEDSILLLCQENADKEEVIGFCQMLGYSSLMCYEKTAEFLGLTDCILRQAYIINRVCGDFEAENLGEENYRSAYRLICENIPDSFDDTKEAYLSFLSDFTYRKRRSRARMKGITENGLLLSTAMTAAETDKAALMSGVACDKNTRKAGLGKRTVLGLAKELLNENKKVHIIALNESAEGFYEHIGFNKDNKIAFYER